MDQENKSNLSVLHEQLVKDNYAVPKDYKAFEDIFSNPENAKTLHDQLLTDKYAVPSDYDSFVNTFGLKKKDLYETLGFGRDLVKEVFGDSSPEDEPVSKKPPQAEINAELAKERPESVRVVSEDMFLMDLGNDEYYNYKGGIYSGRDLAGMAWNSTHTKKVGGQSANLIKALESTLTDAGDQPRSIVPIKDKTESKEQNIAPKYSLKTPLLSDHSVSDVMDKAMKSTVKEKPDLAVPDVTLNKPELQFPDRNVNDVMYEAFRAPLKIETENPTFMDYVTALPQGFNMRMGEAIRNIGAVLNAPKEGVKSLVKKSGGKNADINVQFLEKAFSNVPLLGMFSQENMDELANVIEKAGNPGEIPNDLIGKTLGSTGSILFDIMAVRSTPTTKLNALSKYGMERVPMFPTYLAAMGGATAARDGGGLGETTMAAAEGLASGLTYEGMGIGAGRIGKLVQELGGGQVLSSSSRALANSAMFGADSKLKGGTFMEGAAMGLVFGGYDMGMEAIQRSIAHRAYVSYLTTTDNAIKTISKMQIDPAQMRKNSDALWDAYEKEVDPAKKKAILEEKTAIDNILNVNAITQEIIKNPQVFIDNIQKDTRLSDKEKKVWTEKIKTTVKDNDPRLAEAESIANDIKQKEGEKQFWQNDETIDPVIKNAKVEAVTTQIEEQKKALGNTLGKPLEDYAPKKEKGTEKEKPKDEVFNKQQVVESILQEIPEEARDMMRGELTSVSREDFNKMAEQSGFNSLGSYWTRGTVAKESGSGATKKEKKSETAQDKTTEGKLELGGKKFASEEELSIYLEENAFDKEMGKIKEGWMEGKDFPNPETLKAINKWEATKKTAIKNTYTEGKVPVDAVETKQNITDKFDKQKAIKDDKIFKEQKKQLMDDLVSAEDILLGSNKENVRAREEELRKNGMSQDEIDNYTKGDYEFDLNNLPKDAEKKLNKLGIKVKNGLLVVDVYKDGTVEVGDIRTALRIIDKGFPTKIKGDKVYSGPGKLGKSQYRDKAESYGSLEEAERRVMVAEDNLAEARKPRTQKIGKETKPLTENKGLIKVMEEQLAEAKAVRDVAKDMDFTRIQKINKMNADKGLNKLYDENKDQFEYNHTYRENLYDILEKQGRPDELTYDKVQPLVIKDALQKEGKTVEEKKVELESNLELQQEELKTKFGRKDGKGLKQPQGKREEMDLKYLNRRIDKIKSDLSDLEKYGTEIEKPTTDEKTNKQDLTISKTEGDQLSAGTGKDVTGVKEESKEEPSDKENLNKEQPNLKKEGLSLIEPEYIKEDYDLSAERINDALYDIQKGLGFGLDKDYQKIGEAIVRVKNHTPEWGYFTEDINRGIKKVINVTVGDYRNVDYRRNKTSLDEIRKEHPDVEFVDIQVNDGESVNGALKRISEAIRSPLKQELKQPEGIKFKDKTYYSVDEVQEDFATGKMTFAEQMPLLEQVRQFEDNLKAEAEKNASEAGKKIGMDVDKASDEFKKKNSDDQGKLMMRFLPPDVISKGNTVLWKELIKIKDPISNWIANRLQEGGVVKVDAMRWISKSISNWWGGLNRTQRDIYAKNTMRGTIQDFAPSEAVEMLGKLNSIINFDPESARRTRDALDPDIAQEKLVYGDLTLAEKKYYDEIRQLNTWVHETNYAKGFIDTETYLKFKDATGDSKYIARMYDKYETMPPEIEEFFKQGNNSTKARIQEGMYEMRKEVDEWKKEHAIIDPAYLTAKRVMQTIQNVAIADYMAQVAQDHPNLIRKVKAGEEVPAGFTKLSSSRKWGEFRNRAVANHIVEDFTGFFYANEVLNTTYNALKLFDRTKLNQFYKKYRTVYNPFVQLGNMTGDMFFASIAGVNPTTLVSEMPNAIRDMNARSPEFKMVLKSGILGSTGITADMTPIQIMEAITSPGTVQAETALTKARGMFEKLDEKATKLYQGADNVAKYSAYKIFRGQGLSHEQSVRRVYDAFQNYATVGKTWDVASKIPIFGNKFVKFQADLQRILLNSVTTSPLTTAGTLMLISLAGKMVSALSGETDEEREIRESRKGVAKIPLPFGASVPLSFKIGKSEVNMARYLAPLYIYKYEDSDADVAELSKFMPVQMQKVAKAQPDETMTIPAFSDPALGFVAALVYDRDFRGMSISNPKASMYHNPNTPTEIRILNRLNYIGRSQVPFYRSAADLYNGITGNLDYYGRKRDWKQSILNNLIKIQQFDKPELKSYVERNVEYLTNRFASLSQRMGDANGAFIRAVEESKEKELPERVIEGIYKKEDKIRAKSIDRSLDEQVKVMQELERLTGVYKRWYPDDPFIEENFSNIQSGKNQRFNVIDDIDLQKKYKDEYFLLRDNGLIKRPEVPSYLDGKELTEDERKAYTSDYWSEYMRQLDMMVGLTPEEFEGDKGYVVSEEPSETAPKPTKKTLLQVKATSAAEVARNIAKMNLMSKTR